MSDNELIEHLHSSLKSTGDLMILHRDKACENGQLAFRLQEEKDNLKKQSDEQFETACELIAMLQKECYERKERIAVLEQENAALKDDHHKIAQRLSALLPELEYSRETHVQWRDCDQTHRDRNPKIGSSEFHAQCVTDYDERIAAIKEAVTALEARS